MTDFLAELHEAGPLLVAIVVYAGLSSNGEATLVTQPTLCDRLLGSLRMLRCVERPLVQILRMRWQLAGKFAHIDALVFLKP